MRPESRRIPALDLLRAFAITLVFGFHYQQVAGPGWLRDVFGYGWAGVDLFFVLSGYLIASQLVARPTSAADFYRRRAFRILPAYLAVLAVYFAFPNFKEGPTIAPLWRFLTFTQNLGLDFTASRGFSNAWSLCVEEQFYLLLPIALALAGPSARARWVALGFGAAILAGAGLRAFLWHTSVAPLLGGPGRPLYIAYYRAIYYPTWCRLDPILLGVGIALVERFRPARWARVTARGAWACALGIALLSGAAALCART